MTLTVIVRDRATQDLRLQANYILAKGDWKVAENFLECAELTFFQLSKTPKIGKKVSLLSLTNQKFVNGESKILRITSFLSTSRGDYRNFKDFTQCKRFNRYYALLKRIS